MATCKINEVAILKGAFVKLDTQNVMVLSYMYHGADKEAKRNGTDKSFYRYEGRVCNIEDLKTEVKDLMSDSKKLLKWKWPTKSADWNPEWICSYDGYDDNAKAAKWHASRLSKAMTWDDFMKLARDGVKMTAKGERKSENAKYDLEDYVDEDGNKFSVTSPEAMLKLKGKTFSKKCVLKREATMLS